MKPLKSAPMLLALTLSLAAGGAAGQVQFNVPAELPIPKSTLTRAEVIADVLIWRASGLADLHSQGERSVDPSTLEYARASARYNHMRASPQFAVLVDQVSRGVATKVLVASR
jgi:hypothetical protein